MLKMRISNSRKGFSLIEALVSILLLTMLVGSIIVTLIIGALIIEKTKNRAKAMNLLQAEMEWVKAQTPSTIEGLIGSPIVENDVDDAIGKDDLINDTRTTTVSYHNDRLKVVIILNWEKRGMVGLVAKGDEDNPDERIVTLISP